MAGYKKNMEQYEDLEGCEKLMINLRSMNMIVRLQCQNLILIFLSMIFLEC